MLTRTKTFDATGVAPNGKLYAGDLNAIQDAVAAASDLAQTIGAASYQVGESGLTIVRFGAGEARLTGALRTDGKVRAGGGLDVGMTTAQRDAIAPGSRPPGMLIFNTTTGRPEANMGTDASPSWQGQYTEVPVGAMIDWPWAAAGIPSWAALCYGQPVSRTTYAVLNALANAVGYSVYGIGDGSTTFNLPDMRGRIGVGKDNMGGVTPSWVDGSAIGRITVAINGFNGTVIGATGGAGNITLISGQIPAHQHGTIATAPGGAHTPSGSADGIGNHSHGGNTQGRNQGHTHSSSIGRSYNVNNAGLRDSTVPGAQFPGDKFAGNALIVPGAGGLLFGYITDGESVDHWHVIGADGAHGHSLTMNGVADHAHNVTVGNQTGTTDQAHFNCQPSIVVNKMMRAL